MAITVDVDLRVDLQTMDETGLPWALLDAAPNSSRIVPGRHIVAGSGSAIAVAVVVDITDEGIVHVHPLSASVASNAHLLEYQDQCTDPASARLPETRTAPVGTGRASRHHRRPGPLQRQGGAGPDGISPSGQVLNNPEVERRGHDRRQPPAGDRGCGWQVLAPSRTRRNVAVLVPARLPLKLPTPGAVMVSAPPSWRSPGSCHVSMLPST